jgi:hypothetical protein
MSDISFLQTLCEFKFSTPCIFAVKYFFLFQLNARLLNNVLVTKHQNV